MAGSVNKVTLVGNLGRDPEVRFSQDGKKIVNMSIATSESWNDKASGERRERTEWHRVVIFNERLADVAEKYLKKGAKVFLEGQLQTRKWTGQDGAEKYTTEVVLSRDGPPAADSQEDYGTERSNSSSGSSSDARRPAADDLDDEIPF